jgi:hypothetical protein
MAHRALWLVGAFVLAPAVSGSAAPLDRELDVLDAVFRFQHRQFLAGTGEQLVICLAVRGTDGRAQDPPEALIPRFRREAYRPLSACRVSADGVVERSTGKPAVLFTAGPVTAEADDDLRVEATYFRDQRRVAVSTYRVVLESGRWVNLGPIFKQDLTLL